MLAAHKIYSGPLWLNFRGGAFVRGSRLTRTSYRDSLRYISGYCRLPGKLTLHSARRAGAQYCYFVLNYTEAMLLAHFGWEDENEMRKYLGLGDKRNGYVKLRFAKAGWRAKAPDQSRRILM